MSERHGESKLGFLDALTGLFRSRPPDEAPGAAPAPGPAQGFDALRADFEAALRDLSRKAEESRPRQASAPGAAGPGRQTAEERAADEARRLEAALREVREDIASAHARLKTGLEGADLEALAAWVEELGTQVEAGRDSHELLPRARFAIAERLRAEAGELAVARLVERMGRQGWSWPDPIRHRPSAEPEEIERARQRRLAESRKSFLGQTLARTAERLLGVVEVWGPDYPDRGSPLWEETVLEGVAAGLRAELVKQAVEVLRRDRERILAQTEASIGKELASLQRVLGGSVTSFEEAHRAVASSLAALDAVLPGIAWEHVRSQLPQARGEWGA